MPTVLEKPRIQCRHWDDQNRQSPASRAGERAPLHVSSDRVVETGTAIRWLHYCPHAWG